ncbi:MAG: DoxX family protein [Pseudorhodoplanes sp.]
MNVIYLLGRIAFVVIFIVSGATKLMDIGATASMIGAKVILPAQLSGLAEQLQNALGMTVPQMMAVASGVIELAGGLMIAANIGTRVAAFILILFTAAATFYFHDFWNMAGDARLDNLVHAQKNLSIIGALLVFFVLGPWRPAMGYEEPEVVAPPAPRF